MNIVHRVATTKMRETLSDEQLRVKDEHFMEIAGRLIAKLGIVPPLMFGLDETNVQFVPRPKYTYSKKGVKRVRVLGIGEKEKLQVTCTLMHNFLGEVGITF
jgi:hypothetical protein